MKKNAIITIDSTTAQVTKAFYKQARIFGTPEYETWKAYRQDFPNATMETKSIKKNPNKKSYKNLTYANIESYLKVQPNGAELLKEFEEKKATTRIEKNPYHEVLKWFLKKFDKEKYEVFFADKDKATEATTEDKPPAESSTAAEEEAPAGSAELDKAS